MLKRLTLLTALTLPLFAADLTVGTATARNGQRAEGVIRIAAGTDTSSASSTPGRRTPGLG